MAAMMYLICWKDKAPNWLNPSVGFLLLEGDITETPVHPISNQICWLAWGHEGTSCSFVSLGSKLYDWSQHSSHLSLALQFTVQVTDLHFLGILTSRSRLEVETAALSLPGCWVCRNMRWNEAFSYNFFVVVFLWDIVQTISNASMLFIALVWVYESVSTTQIFL
jgi:hypothetical protein